MNEQITPPTFSIELTVLQAQDLLRLLDVATKSGGLQVAPAAVFFHDTINKAFKESKLPVPA